jgi:hypothetical protein
MICNDLSEMVLELKILFHDKVAIQQVNTHKLLKQGGGGSWIPSYHLNLSHKDSNLEFLWLNLFSINKLMVNFS